MLHRSLARWCLVATLCVPTVAQQPGAKPAAPARDAQKADALRTAFVDADGHRRISITLAAEQVLASDAAGRARFMATLRAIAAVAPKPSAPEPAATPANPTPPTAKPAEAKPIEFADEIKQLMASVVTGTAEASQAALAKLSEDKLAGPAALQRMDERGKAIFERCLLSLFRKRMQTNAMYAGQYSDMAGFQPEVTAVLLRWALDAPKDAPTPDAFPGACLRALRDVVPTDKATDAMRDSLRKIAAKAQAGNKAELFMGAVCALHQYGDPSAFDKIKAAATKRATAENVQDKAGALNTLADLHYQLRRYEDAANYYKSLVELMETSGQQTQGFATTIYNAACSFSLAAKTDEAVQYLEKALQVNVKNRTLTKAMLDEDQDLKNVRQDPRFQQLIEQFFGKAVAPPGK